MQTLKPVCFGWIKNKDYIFIAILDTHNVQFYKHIPKEK